MNYADFLKKIRLPPGYDAPTRLTYDDIVATAISRANLSDDVRGINASIGLIQKTRGGRLADRTGHRGVQLRRSGVARV